MLQVASEVLRPYCPTLVADNLSARCSRHCRTAACVSRSHCTQWLISVADLRLSASFAAHSLKRVVAIRRSSAAIASEIATAWQAMSSGRIGLLGIGLHTF